MPLGGYRGAGYRVVCHVSSLVSSRI